MSKRFDSWGQAVQAGARHGWEGGRPTEPSATPTAVAVFPAEIQIPLRHRAERGFPFEAEEFGPANGGLFAVPDLLRCLRQGVQAVPVHCRTLVARQVTDPRQIRPAVHRIRLRTNDLSR
ncbi:putative protein OS=Streptomyces canus OX=58343 GN=AQI96_08615 PE=4 SV=1 [Streptomyces canus]